LEFHFVRGDFAAWLQYIGASRVAQRVKHIKLETCEHLREQLQSAVQ
jgi:hypothetical protein